MAASGRDRGGSTSKQFVCVTDVEATRVESDYESRFFKQELVELPAVILDVRPGKDGSERATPAAVFHTFVRPTENPRLNRDTTGFMPIRQDDVDAAPPFAIAFAGFVAFIRHGSAVLQQAAPHSICASSRERGPSVKFSLVREDDLNETTIVLEGPERNPELASDRFGNWCLVLDPALATDGAGDACELTVEATRRALDAGRTDGSDSVILAADGPWDIGCYLSHEAFRKDCLRMWHPVLSRWWNIRWQVGDSFRGGSARGLNVVTQLAVVGTTFVGTEHSGMDDTLNIAHIASVLIRRGVRPRMNDGLAGGSCKLVGRVFRPPWFQRHVLAKVEEAGKLNARRV